MTTLQFGKTRRLIEFGVGGDVLMRSFSGQMVRVDLSREEFGRLVKAGDDVWNLLEVLAGILAGQAPS